MATNFGETFEDGTSINVTITDEGVIIDAFDQDGECIGTEAATFGELFERIADPVLLSASLRFPLLPNVGDRIELISMDDDPWAIEPGERGTVTRVNPDPEYGQIVVNWDSGRSLILLPTIDKWKLLHRASKRGNP